MYIAMHAQHADRYSEKQLLAAIKITFEPLQKDNKNVQTKSSMAAFITPNNHNETKRARARAHVYLSETTERSMHKHADPLLPVTSAPSCLLPLKPQSITEAFPEFAMIPWRPFPFTSHASSMAVPLLPTLTPADLLL